MRKNILIVLSCVVLITLGALLNNPKTSANSLGNYYNKKMNLIEFSGNKESNIYIEIDKSGRFYKEYLNGDFEGIVEIFDGKNFYMHDKKITLC